MSVKAKFDAFLSNIQLTDRQIEDAKTKHTAIRDVLQEAYYDWPYPATTSILVGSYAKHTAARPPTDVDILFIMPSHRFSYYQGYAGNGPSRLLQDVKAVLQGKYPKTGMRGDGQVVVVSFASGFGVEVVPVFASDKDGVYHTPDTHDGGSWKTTNPEAERSRIAESNRISNSNTVHLIKMTKIWKHVCQVPLSSFPLELLAVAFLSRWEHCGKSSFYYDWMVRDFFQHMLSRVNGWEIIPGVTEIYGYGDAWETKADAALRRATKACEYESGDKDDLATAEWVKIFGGFFTGQQ